MNWKRDLMTDTIHKQTAVNGTDFYWKRFGMVVKGRRWIKDEYGIVETEDTMIRLDFDNVSNKLCMSYRWESSDG